LHQTFLKCHLTNDHLTLNSNIKYQKCLHGGIGYVSPVFYLGNISTGKSLQYLAFVCLYGEWLGAGMVICLLRGADLHMAPLMSPPLIVSCFSKIQIVTTQHYTSTLLAAVMCPSICLSVRPSVHHMLVLYQDG